MKTETAEIDPDKIILSKRIDIIYNIDYFHKELELINCYKNYKKKKLDEKNKLPNNSLPQESRKP